MNITTFPNHEETGPPSITLTAEEILACAQLLEKHDVATLGELIAHVLHRGTKKYRAAYWFRQTLEDLTKEANHHGPDRDNAAKILEILAGHGITQEFIDSY